MGFPCPSFFVIIVTLMIRKLLITLSIVSLGASSFAQKTPDKPAPKKKKQAAAKEVSLAALEPKFTPLTLRQEGHQIDFPMPARSVSGQIYIAHIDHDTKADALRLVRENDGKLDTVATLVESAVLHPPAIALQKDGPVWTFWPQTHSEDHTVDLLAKQWTEKGVLGKTITISNTDAAEAFVDAGTDSEGRVWVAWQSMRAGHAQIFARYYHDGDGRWSKEFPITTDGSGCWEPRLAFDNNGNAWITYDTSRGNEFNINLARVSPDGKVETHKIGHTERYEARAAIKPTEDRSGFWIAGERGRIRWGLDARGHENATGINAQKEIMFGKFDIQTGTFTEIPPGPAGEAGSPVNLPAIGVDQKGNPWIAYRYFIKNRWSVAMTRYYVAANTWTSRRQVADATFGQDRRMHFLDGGTDIQFCWPSDLRKNKAHGEAGITLATYDAATGLPDAKAPGEPKDFSAQPFSPSQKTPERPADDRHIWKTGGKELGLYWGDLHRHTDVSNCRTGFDGCIVEHFRYAYDIAKLDFLGTSDHTDIGKIYHPYEWWHNQRQHDALHSPEQFNSLYVYEREQRWPWGHRNVVFAQRGGPIIYIQRRNYNASPWASIFPLKPGVGEINPPELWDVIKRYGKPTALISHTGATGMGTDWGKYDKFEYANEGIVEIFQGARVSYEGAGAPQPTVGLRPAEGYTINGDAKATPPAPVEDFGKYSAGTYQNALDLGLKLGVFASSDHISQHVSYGGVFCEDFTREGIVSGFNSRRTIAATDKIYLNFTCNGEILGSEIKTEKDPELWFKVDGTAPLKRVTIVRNEKNWKVFDQITSTAFEQTVTDDAMLEGENRYYIRVEQTDGNMAWSSPVWVTK